MLSEKVTRILKKRGLSSELISSMSENAAWDYVYQSAEPKKEKVVEVCFTGFSDSEKSELAQLATAARLRVVTRVTKSLSFLCAGENAGPMKLEQAKEQQAIVMSRRQFEHFLQTGEIAS